MRNALIAFTMSGSSATVTAERTRSTAGKLPHQTGATSQIAPCRKATGAPNSGHCLTRARGYQIGLECATVACPLAWASLTWMTAEGAIAAIAGLIANSIALIGFGIDSAIEGLASLIIIWRFSGSRRLSEQAERRAQKLVAISFFLLAPYIAVEAIRNLVTASKPGTSWLGIGLTIASAISMPFLGIAKKRLGTRLHSAATVGEGTQNLIGARPINPPREAELEAGDRYARLSWPRR